MTVNPLRDPLDRRLPRIPEPCALVIFGVTGDLARKKLIPATYDLAQPGTAARRASRSSASPGATGVDGEFEAEARESAQLQLPHAVSGGGVGSPGRQHHSSYPDPSTTTLPSTCSARPWIRCVRPMASKATRRSTWPSRRPRSRWCSSRCNAPAWPTTSGPVGWPPGGGGEALRQRPQQLPRAQRARRRCLHPAGRVPHRPLSSVKETVQNIMALRFANALFEPVWDSRLVNSVQITMAEDVGIGTRAAFYDSAGAARDVLQNHLMQLLALVRDGGAVELRRGRDPHREAQGAAGDRPPRGHRHRTVRAIRAGLGWPASEPLATSRRKVSRRTRPLRRTCGAAGHPQPPVGRGAVLTSAPASACRGASPRSR